MNTNPCAWFAHPCGACWGAACRHKYPDGRQIALNDRVKIAGPHPQTGIVAELTCLGQVVVDVFPRLSITGFPSLRYRTDPSAHLAFVESNQVRAPK